MEGTIYLDCYKLIRCKSRLKPIRRLGDLPDKLLKQRTRSSERGFRRPFVLYLYLLLSGGVAVFQNIQNVFRLAESS